MKVRVIIPLAIMLVTIITLIICSCEELDDIRLDYCKMLELDQSHVNNDQSDLEMYNLDRQKRHEIFKENFNQIIQYSEQSGFPEMGSLKSSGLDSCRNWVLMITLFHVGQSQPNLFFEKDAKQLITKEIREGRLKSGSLFPPLREGFQGHEFCTENKEEIYAALNLWKIKIDELPEIKFVDCSK